MITQKQFKDHYQNLYNKKAIYVWGANGETITKNLIDRLYRTFGSKTYDKKYYDNKLKEGDGKIGADCSGSIYPLSKKDNTAKGYYNACSKKGSINALPSGTACLIFNKDFTHVGAYMGDGTTIEMMNSKDNCVKQTLRKSRWAYYGIPDWLEVPAPTAPKPSTSGNEVIKNIQRWCNRYCSAGLIVDGVYGPNTKKGLCKALQYTLNIYYKANLTVDGIFGAQTKAKCKVASKCKELSYICQAMLYIKGYNMSHSIKNNDLDASYGSGTKKAVKEYQQDARGLVVDGQCGAATFYTMFNS